MVEKAMPAAEARLDARIFLLALGTFAIGTDVFVIAGILPAIARDLAVPVEAAGQIVTLYALTYALGSPLLAAVTAPWRKERVIILALAGFAFADAVCAVAPNFLVLAVARVLAGSCAALYAPTAYALAAALAPPARRGAGLAAVALGMTSATVFGVPLGAAIGHRFGWHVTFMFGMTLAACAAMALAYWRLPALGATPAPRLRERFAPLGDRAVLLPLVANFLWSTGNYIVYTYSAVLFGARLGLDDIALLLMGYGCGGLAGSQLGGRLADRVGAVPLILGCVGVNALNMAAIDFTGGSFIGAFAALFMLAFSGWAVFPAQQTRLLALAPAHGGVVLSLISSTIYIGSASGAAIGGLLLAHAAPPALPIAAAIVVVLGIVIFATSLGRARRDECPTGASK